jgi:cation transport regulator ChaB
MSENSALADNLFSGFINWLYASGEISVPSTFHERCEAIRNMMDNDTSGVVNSLINYAVQSASEAKYRIECSESTLQKLLNTWLQEINLDVKGIPTGLTALSKEYFKERWAGSSFCALRVTGWDKITVEGVTIEVPTVMWYANGSSLYVKRQKKYKLGSDKYYLDREMEEELIINRNEYTTIQKPFNRWFDQYATPYLIKNGVYKNWRALNILQGKSDEAVSKALPYLFLMIKGLPELFLQADISYTDPELKEMVDNFKTEVEKYRNEKGKIPAHGIPFDQKYEHLIPDLSKIVSEELFRQGYRAILSGLGFIDVIQGISSTRKESVLNPKPFLAEVNDGVDGFKMMLLDIIYQIIDRNKESHREMFSDKGQILVVNSPLKINVEQILDAIRSGFDRGVISIESYMSTLGFDFEIEKEKRQKELSEGYEDLFYPHLIQNREDVPDRFTPTKPRTQKQENLEDEGKNPKTPESKNFKSAAEEVEEAKIEEKGNHYRVRQVDPSEFEEDSFRTIWISQDLGIKAVIGRRKGETTTTIQSLLFVKEKWTVEKIRQWIKEHSDRFHAYAEIAEANITEDLVVAPYKDNSELPPAVKKYPSGAQTSFRETFNEVYNKTHDESKAFPIAWNSLKRWMKKHGYAFKDGKWSKKSEEEKTSAEIKEKQNKLLDKLLKENENENI